MAAINSGLDLVRLGCCVDDRSNLSVGAGTIRVMRLAAVKQPFDPDVSPAFGTYEHRIYLAGKIAEQDWRHGLVNDLTFVGRAAWTPTLDALGPGIHYTGPYFLADGHGCTYGPCAHGRGNDCSLSGGDSAEQTVELCLRAIDESTALFAWLDDLTAYGTLVEIGYARAKAIPVIAATPCTDAAYVARSSRPATRGDRSDLWFALNTATAHVKAPTPRAAFAKAVKLLNHWRDQDEGSAE